MVCKYTPLPQKIFIFLSLLISFNQCYCQNTGIKIYFIEKYFHRKEVKNLIKDKA